MGFYLKTNNRKKLSGSLLEAKVVSPDYKLSGYKTFPIQVQVQTLSDRECVIRDMQQLDAILSSNNNWSNIDTQVKELNTALKSASNGSKITLGTVAQPNVGFSPSKDENNVVVINNDGVVEHRPPYAPNNQNSDFNTTLRITIKKGSIVEEYTKQMIIPAYTADNVMAEIKNKYWNNSVFWNSIKNNNDRPLNLFSNISIINQDVFLSNNGLKDIYYDSTDTAPTMSLVVPNYYSETLIDKTSGEVATFTATDMYALKSNASYRVQEVKATDLNSIEATALHVDVQNSRDEVVCYRLQSSTDTDNVLSGTWSLDGTSLTSMAYQSPVGFLSSKISTSDILSNISSSIKLSWFIPRDVLEANGLSNTSVGSTSTSNRKIIQIASGKNPIIKVADSLSQLVTSEYEDNTIVDTTGIGYSYDPTTGTRNGFSNSMLNVKVRLSSSMHYTSSSVDPSTSLLSETPEGDVGPLDSSAFDPATTKYLYLDSTEFTNDIDGTLTIELLQTSLGNAVSTTVYFTLKHV